MLIIDMIKVNNKKMFAISILTSNGKHLLKLCNSIEQAKNAKTAYML